MDLSTEAVMRLLVRVVPDLARRSVPVPTKRLGYVDATAAGAYVDVMVDGDLVATSLLNGTGGPLNAGQRVVVDFYPPHGAVVVARLAPLWDPEQVWTSGYDVASSTTVSVASTSWAQVTATGYGWTDASGDLVCELPGLWLVSLQAEFATNGAGTHRAAAMAEASGTHHARVTSQFAAPGGSPTTAYGLSHGGWGYYQADTGDTLGGRARQDSGSPLAVTLMAHLRLLAPA